MKKAGMEIEALLTTMSYPNAIPAVKEERPAHSSAWLLVNWLTMVILGWVWVWLGPCLGLVIGYNQTQNNHGYLVILVIRLNTARKLFSVIGI
jgi:hypothetical protein